MPNVIGRLQYGMYRTSRPVDIKVAFKEGVIEIVTVEPYGKFVFVGVGP